MNPEINTHEPLIDDTLVYTVEEAANRLKVSKWTINRLIEEGEIGSIQIRSRRLVRASDITDFVARQQQPHSGAAR